MALPADYISGTITLTNGSPNFTGTGTGWQAADFREGDILLGVEDHAGQVYVIAAITGNASGTLTQDWAGSSGTYTYRMRYEWDSSRVSAQARAMVELLGNGNLESIAGLTGPGVVVLEGPHSAGIRPFTDFINGVAYNVQVDTLADRAAYDGQTAGFAVLVSDIGDGRSALFSKASNTSGDWTDPAYITGPVGPPADVTVGSTTTLPPGSAATVTPTPTPGGVELDFGIPAGEGFYWAGVYNIANTYNQDDVVRHNRSSFIALQAVPAGESPSSVYPPVDTAYWQALAVAGMDGTGTGDFVGPSSSINDNLVTFDGTTGKLGKDSGISWRNVALQTVGTDGTTDANTITGPGWFPYLLRGGPSYAPNTPSFPDGAYWHPYVYGHTTNQRTQIWWPYGPNWNSRPELTPLWRSTTDGGATWTPYRTISPTSKIVKRFTANGSWSATYPELIKGIRVRVQAAGGGAGGTASDGAGGGGGAGGYGERTLFPAPTGSVAVTVGAGGAGGTTAPSAGGNGGGSSFGTLLTTTGGTGGQPSTGSSGPYAGGTSTGGDLNVVGQSGANRSLSFIAMTPPGGNSSIGFADAVVYSAGNFNSSSLAAPANGAGGLGPKALSGAGPWGGQAGGNGLVIVEEYY